MLPNFSELKLEYRKLKKKKIKEYHKKDVKFYGKMFAKLPKLDYPEANVSHFLSSEIKVYKTIS